MGPGGPFANALLAGSGVAVACGLIGWFVVLRSQVFAGDALSHVAFTGALGAAAAGLDLRVGLFAATVVVALLIAVVGARADDTSIGVVFVWTLGLGALFLDIFNAGGGGSSGTIAARTLFGSLLGLTDGEARLAALVAAGAVGAVLALGRPLLLASIDAPLALAAGAPVRALGFAFMVLLGVVAAEATQAVGALLLLGLLAAPAGAAQRLTANPYRGMALAAGIALGAMWAGLALGYWVAALPPGATVALVATAVYALTMVLGARRR